MGKKITIKEAQRRLHEKINCFDFIEYNGMSKPCKIQCRDCEKILEFATASSAINSMGSHCYNCKRIERLEGYDNWTDKEVQEIIQNLVKCKTIGEFIETVNNLPYGLRGFKDIFTIEILDKKIKNSMGSYNTVPLEGAIPFKNGVLQISVCLYTKFYYNLIKDKTLTKDKEIQGIYVNFYEVPSYSGKVSRFSLKKEEDVVMNKYIIKEISQEDFK